MASSRAEEPPRLPVVLASKGRVSSSSSRVCLSLFAPDSIPSDVHVNPTLLAPLSTNLGVALPYFHATAAVCAPVSTQHFVVVVAVSVSHSKAQGGESGRPCNHAPA